MKRFGLFILSFLILSFVHSQTTGSGTITFNATSTVSIEATATSIFDGGVHVYQITGNTNEAISFGPWVLPGTLSSNDSSFDEQVSLQKNPAGSLNLYIQAQDGDVEVNVYDINGRLISSPKVFSSNSHYIHYYDPMTYIVDGLYFVKINNKGKTSILKFIKHGSEGPIINQASSKNSQNEGNREMMADNYIISWNNLQNYYGGERMVEVLESTSNTFTFNLTEVTSSENGNIAILLTKDGILSAPPGEITMTNSVITDSIYTASTENFSPQDFAIFWSLHVDDGNNPTTYNVHVESLTDEYLPTNSTVDVFQGNNSTFTVIVEPIPNHQDIEIVVRDYEDLSIIEGATVELLEANLQPNSGGTLFLQNLPTDNVLYSMITDGEGKAVFQDVPGGSAIYLRVFKDNYYITTKNYYQVPEVDLIHEMDTLLNVIAVPKLNYWDGTEATADTLSHYSPRVGHGINTEFILGHMNIYIDPGNPNRDSYIQHLEDVAQHLGFQGAFNFVDVPFPNDPPENYSAYNPYPENRNTLDGQVGYNLFQGSSQWSSGKKMINGYPVSFHGTIWGLGTLHVLDHELGHALGFRHWDVDMIGNSVMPWCCSQFEEPTILMSKYDTLGMRLWYRLGQLHYDTLDEEGRLMDYGMTVGLRGFSSNDLVTDDDSDGVMNFYDLCPGTAISESVDEQGCSESQLDDDNDGIVNSLDLCPDTPIGSEVDENGCEI